MGFFTNNFFFLNFVLFFYKVSVSSTSDTSYVLMLMQFLWCLSTNAMYMDFFRGGGGLAKICSYTTRKQKGRCIVNGPPFRLFFDFNVKRTTHLKKDFGLISNETLGHQRDEWFCIWPPEGAYVSL